MFEELEHNVVEMLPSLQEALQKGLNYGGELFEQFVVYRTFYELGNILVYSILLTVMLVASSYFKTSKIKEQKKDYVDDEKILISNIFIYFLYFIAFLWGVAILDSIFVLVKLYVIPELYILDYFR